MEQIPMTFEILPRVVKNIPNIEVSIGKSVVEGYGRNPPRHNIPRKFNLFAHLWSNKVSGGAKMTLPQMREHIKKASWYKRGMGSISSMNKTALQALIDTHEGKTEIVNTSVSTAPPKISASEAVGHENFNVSTPNIGLSELETQAEVAIAERYNANNTKPPPNITLPDTNPLKTEAEEQGDVIEHIEDEQPAEPAPLSTKKTKGHIYEIAEKDLVKWKHPKELGENENVPVIVEANEVFSTQYATNNTYYLPPLDPSHPDMVALNAWIDRNRNMLKPNSDRAGLNEPGKPGKTYSVANTLEKLGYIPKSFGVKTKGKFDYEGITPEGTAWLAEVKASQAYKDAEKSRVPHSTKLKVMNDAYKWTTTTAKEVNSIDPKKTGKLLSRPATRFDKPEFVVADKTGEMVKQWNLVEEILDRIGNRINPLRYTSYQLNIDYFARRHTDGGNRGLSCIFAVGDYSPENGSGLLVVNGRPLDIKYQPLLFNGVDNPHMVLQLTEEDKRNDRHRCSFVMFETRGDDMDEVPVAKNEPPPKQSMTYVAPPKEKRVFTDEEKKRLKRSKEEMTKGWYPNLDTEVLPYTSRRKRDAPQNTIEEVAPYNEDDDNRTFYTAKSWSDEADRFDDDNMSFYTALSGEGKKQHSYSVFMRHLDDAGLLPHMFPHMTGGKMEEHGKEGVSRHNPPIKVSKGQVMTMKYDEDKLYELPPLSKTDPDVKALTQYMMENELPINKSRVNSGIGRSQTIGKVRQKFKSTFNDSAFTKKNPDLKTLLFNIGKKYNPLGFTSVQVNQNYECLPHIDKNNHGLSMIFAVGDYNGGDLYINDKPHNIAYRPLVFNGAKNLHYVSKITKGNRFSFVYFTTGKKKT